MGLDHFSANSKEIWTNTEDLINAGCKLIYVDFYGVVYGTVRNTPDILGYGCDTLRAYDPDDWDDPEELEEFKEKNPIPDVVFSYAKVANWNNKERIQDAVKAMGEKLGITMVAEDHGEDYGMDYMLEEDFEFKPGFNKVTNNKKDIQLKINKYQNELVGADENEKVRLEEIINDLKSLIN